MRTVALITDFGNSGGFAGVMKGAILRVHPRVNIVDITHNISSYNIKEGAFVLWKSYKFFPKKTIFTAVIDPGVGTDRKALAVRTKNYYFVGPDNGVLYPAAKEDGIKEIVSVKKYSHTKSATFHGRDIFAPVSGDIAKGRKIKSLGDIMEADDVARCDFPEPDFQKNAILGRILYIDKFGNIVTNITKKDVSKLNTTSILARLNNKTIKNIYRAYSYASSNKPFFIEDSFGYLEIAVKNSSARDYFKLKDMNKRVIVKPMRNNYKR